MSGISQYIGSQIKLYRKNKRLTQEELAGRIRKSKATLSKYEGGDIVLDVETLNDIARELEVPVTCLLGGYEPAVRRLPGQNPVTDMFVYFLDDRGVRVRESYLEITGTDSGLTATMYCDAEGGDKSRSTLIYVGEIRVTETVISFELVSTKNNLDQIFFTSLRPFLNQGEFVEGLCIGLNFAPICPVCFKTVLAYRRCQDEQLLFEMLRVSSAEMKAFRKTSRFCL